MGFDTSPGHLVLLTGLAMGKQLSYVVGIAIAGVVVFGLYMAMHFGSPAYARQVSERRAASEDLDGLVEMLGSRNIQDKLAAITEIGKGDDQVDRRVRLLAAATIIADDSIQSVCNLSIRRFGDRAKPTVRELLKSEDPEDFSLACGVIRALGSEADEFAKVVIERLNNGDKPERHAAMYALQDMSPKVLVSSLDAVTKELKDENFNTQCMACYVLKAMGPEAKPAVGPLLELLENGNPSTKSRAAQALAAIGPVEGFDVPGKVAEGLTAFSQMQKVRTLDAMGVLGKAGIEHLDAIEDLIKNPRLNCVPEAALAYYRVSGKSEMPMKVLGDALEKRYTRMSAISCLGGMGDVGKTKVTRLIDFLFDEDPAVVETTILALKGIGPGAKDALPKLNKLTRHEDFLITVAAHEAIAAIDVTGKSSTN